jgi:hypothetical protein
MIAQTAQRTQMVQSRIQKEEYAIQRASMWLEGLLNGTLIKTCGGISLKAEAVSGSHVLGAGWRRAGIMLSVGNGPSPEGCHVIVRVEKGGETCFVSQPTASGRLGAGGEFSCSVQAHRDVALRLGCAGDIRASAAVLFAPDARGKDAQNQQPGVVVRLQGMAGKMDAFGIMSSAESAKTHARGTFVPQIRDGLAEAGQLGGDMVMWPGLARLARFCWLVPRGLGSGAIREVAEKLKSYSSEAVCVNVSLNEDSIVQAAGRPVSARRMFFRTV